MRRAIALMALLGLSGCGSMLVRHARTDLVGLRAADLEACAGVPDQVRRLDRRDIMAVYEAKPAADGFAMTVFSELKLQAGPPSGCKALFRIGPDGRVAAVRFAGTIGSVSGPDAACAPLVAECVKHRPAEAVAGDYDPALLLGERAPKP